MTDCYEKLAEEDPKKIRIGGTTYQKKDWAINPVGRKKWMSNAKNIIQTEIKHMRYSEGRSWLTFLCEIFFLLTLIEE